MSSVMNPICRGLVAYISFLATCKTSTAYTEHLLYEPTLRIARAQGWDVRCEVPVADSKSGKGAKKKIDLVLTRGKEIVALEIKWITTKSPHLQNDIDKLAIHRCKTGGKGYVLIFGRTELLEELTPITETRAKSKTRLINWNNEKTNYGAICYRYA